MELSLLRCIPFGGMLLSIAIFPTVSPKVWAKMEPFAVAFWIILLVIPNVIKYGAALTATRIGEVMITDYIPFIILLFGLYCVTGNIAMESDMGGTPKENLLLLLIGALLSSWIGTTGASMVLIRPVLKTNNWRKRKIHTIVFFIFLVSNIGGILTPVGDPPLLMGFMRDIPFFWSLNMLPMLLLNVGLLLAMYYFIEKKSFAKDVREGLHSETLGTVSVKIKGYHNVVFLAMIIASVIISGVLADDSFFSQGIALMGGVEVTYSSLLEIFIILIATILSMKTTRREIRIANDFSWSPIIEVAILFIGIFITMIPALEMLETNSAGFTNCKPAQMFWLTGIMSSFLDNTPTYLVFLTSAGTMGATSGITTSVGIISEKMLIAISAGAVFMGANTYIGNAPNFMVKTVAEESGIKMPSFLGYMGWAMVCLIPVFIIDCIIFLF